MAKQVLELLSSLLLLVILVWPVVFYYRALQIKEYAERHKATWKEEFPGWLSICSVSFLGWGVVILAEDIKGFIGAAVFFGGNILIFGALNIYWNAWHERLLEQARKNENAKQKTEEEDLSDKGIKRN